MVVSAVLSSTYCQLSRYFPTPLDADQGPLMTIFPPRGSMMRNRASLAGSREFESSRLLLMKPLPCTVQQRQSTTILCENTELYLRSMMLAAVMPILGLSRPIFLRSARVQNEPATPSRPRYSMLDFPQPVVPWEEARQFIWIGACGFYAAYTHVIIHM